MQNFSTEMLLAMFGIFVVGKIFKEIPKFPDWCIPLTLTGFSCLFTPLLFGGYTTYNFFIALVAVGITVYGDQLWKQTVYGLKKSGEEGGDTNG